MKRLIIEPKPSSEEQPSVRLVKTYYSREEKERDAYRDSHNFKTMKPADIVDLNVLIADGEGIVEGMDEEGPSVRSNNYAMNNRDGEMDVCESMISIKSTKLSKTNASEGEKSIRSHFDWKEQVEEDADHFSDYGGYYGGYGGVYYSNF